MERGHERDRQTRAQEEQERGLRLTDTFKGCMYHIGSTKLIDGSGNAPHLEAEDDVITIAAIKANWPGLAGANTKTLSFAKELSAGVVSPTPQRSSRVSPCS